MSRADKAAEFGKLYEPALRVAHKEHPGLYGTNPPPADVVARRMVEALKTGSYHHAGPAMRATCKQLGIPYSRKGIEEYLGPRDN